MRDRPLSLPGLRKSRSTWPRLPLRVLVAEQDPEIAAELSALLSDRYAPAVPLQAGDVPNALEALLIRHPDLVITDLGLPGHSQGGFRLILDAVSLGVPAVVVCGKISAALERRLDELGVSWVARGSHARELFAAIDRALLRAQLVRDGVSEASQRVRFQTA